LSSPTTRRLLPRYSRKQVSNDDLIASIDQVGQKLTDYLSLMESALTILVQRRPPPGSDLSEADRTATIHQDALRDKFADPITDQLSPTIDMLQIGQHPEESLHTILEKNPDSESQGSMEIVAETATVQPPFPPFRGGGIFNVSINSPPWDGQTDEDHAARVNRNANRAQCRANEATIVLAEAASNGEQLDSQGRPRPLRRNLDDEFVRVNDHDVYKTPSANLVVAANELARPKQTPEVTKVAAMLKATHYQLNEIRQE
jgi:hypothetical protein